MDETALTHLLQMYPVSALRETWGTTKGMKKDELIASVIGTIPERAIVEFCRIHQPLTKQRIMLFDNQGDSLNAFADPLIDLDSRTYFNRTAQEIEEFYILTVTYEALVGGPTYEPQQFDFPWPVRIVINSKHTIVTFTIIEKTLTPYLPPNKSAVNVHKAYDEDDVCSRLIQRLPSPSWLNRCDLHRGVKALWEADEIDAAYVGWKEDISTDTKTMDAKHLMKRDNPAAYAKAMAAPLLKSVFKTVSQSKFPPIFTVAPLDGEVSLHRHSETLTEVQNVVRAILAAN